MTQKKYAINTDFYKQYGMTMAEMARRSGVTRECIRRRYRRGIRVDGPNRAYNGGARKSEAKMQFAKKVERVKALKDEGLGATAIAKDLGIEFASASRLLKKARRGQTIDVQRIETLNNEGWRGTKIAREMGINKSSVYHHLKQKNKENDNAN